MKHLVFYDGACGFCDHVVQWLIRHDKSGIFLFAPLKGETADIFLQGISREDSLVLIENFQTPHQKMFLFGQAAFRILWLLKGPWMLLGWINFLPPCLYNWGYTLVAKNRHHFFSSDVCSLPDPSLKDRFLK